ncbi:uncharacterized protein YaiI (UPF0178 family) [Peribacillus deserti]|uniref:UPF0178 protein JOC77_001202 n=1 Tax=Peribacillus deserti TaxID=673318 RepID=A0ABS2QF62_9BACI|nr:YaiI/YqxD family protein [Peribacillus deserti]MBM7691792.1 uncharacterized protein YaiI (UPF0178 family) [Peribacillus deserti]
MKKNVELQKGTIIYVDADACPVKDEITKEAKHYNLEVCFVTSVNNMMNSPSEGNWVYVENEKEAADLYILNHAKKGDLVITGDIGLAGTLLPKNVYVLSPRGMEYTENNIGSMLEMRYLAGKMRRQGKYTKGPKPFRKEDRDNFLMNLSKMLSNLAGK